MARRWNNEEEKALRTELKRLYVKENLSIREIAKTLSLGESTVFQRLRRLGITSTPQRKKGYLNTRRDIQIPKKRTETLAEFFGIMLGDGHISHFQTVVTLGTKEEAYVNHVAKVMKSLFKVSPHICIRKRGHRDVYIGSTELTAWLRSEGLVPHKVRSQVDVPPWIFTEEKYMKNFLRGFFDTDGSIYQLKYGRQLSFSNNSVPLLCSLRTALIRLKYSPSEVSGKSVYVTRSHDIDRFFKEVAPANTKHLRRYNTMMRR